MAASLCSRGTPSVPGLPLTPHAGKYIHLHFRAHSVSRSIHAIVHAHTKCLHMHTCQCTCIRIARKARAHTLIDTTSKYRTSLTRGVRRPFPGAGVIMAVLAQPSVTLARCSTLALLCTSTTTHCPHARMGADGRVQRTAVGARGGHRCPEGWRQPQCRHRCCEQGERPVAAAPRRLAACLFEVLAPLQRLPGQAASALLRCRRRYPMVHACWRAPRTVKGKLLSP